VLYEMLCGDPPFFSEKNLISETYGLIMNWKVIIIIIFHSTN